MVIYATGFNPADSNSLKRSPRVALFQAVNPLIGALRAGGNSITWRETKVGYPLHPEVDAVLVSVMLPRSLNCPYALGAIWTISEALRLEIPLVLYLTDWAFFKAAGEFKSIAKAGQPYFSKQIGGSLQYNEDPVKIERHGEELLEVCRQWNDPNSVLWKRAQILVPRYTNWGDVSIIQNLLPGANKVCTMDPTPSFINYLEETIPPMDNRTMEDRAKWWTYPSLLKDSSWLDKQPLRWPIDRFGPKGYPVLPSEREVQLQYRKNIGALCPPYPTAGSGWWRSRWIHSSIAGSVLLCDKADAEAVGLDHWHVGVAYRHTGYDYEHMSYGQLQRCSEEQRELMDQLLQTDMEVFVDQVYQPFRRAGA